VHITDSEDDDDSDLLREDLMTTKKVDLDPTVIICGICRLNQQTI
jgi:hypothetical protein